MHLMGRLRPQLCSATATSRGGQIKQAVRFITSYNQARFRQEAKYEM